MSMWACVKRWLSQATCDKMELNRKIIRIRKCCLRQKEKISAAERFSVTAGAVSECGGKALNAAGYYGRRK